MKQIELKQIINKVVKETLDEALYTEKPGADRTNTLPNVVAPDPSTEKDPMFQAKYKKVSEGEEMNESRKYGVADDAKMQTLMDATQGKAKERIRQIVNAIAEAGGRITAGGIAKALNLRQQQINDLLRSMVEAGVLNIEGGKEFGVPLAQVRATRAAEKAAVRATTADEEGTIEPSDEEDDDFEDEESEFTGGGVDMLVGRGEQNYNKLMGQYFDTDPSEVPEDTEDEFSTTDNAPEEYTKRTEDDIIASGSAGEWLIYNFDLIQTLINKARERRKIKENLSNVELTKLSVEKLQQMLVDKLRKVKEQNPKMLNTILINLRDYKFGPTNTTNVYRNITTALGTQGDDTYDSKNLEEMDCGCDDDMDMDFDDDMLDEPIMERFQKLAKIIK